MRGELLVGDVHPTILLAIAWYAINIRVSVICPTSDISTLRQRESKHHISNHSPAAAIVSAKLTNIAQWFPCAQQEFQHSLAFGGH